MGILDNFEKGLERAVNGAFAKTFRSGLQPVELTSALRRELDTKAAVVSRDRVLAPNSFTLRMSAKDLARMRQMGGTLTDELAQFVQQHADSQGYQFAGPVEIEMSADDSLSEGMLGVDSENIKGTVVWAPVLEINGARHQLTGPSTVIGRSSHADITVDDTGISRRHVEILWDGATATARDLGSTNGSQLDGRTLTEARLAPDSVVTIGHTRIVFRLLPQAQRTEKSRGPAVDDATKRQDIAGFWESP